MSIIDDLKQNNSNKRCKEGQNVMYICFCSGDDSGLHSETTLVDICSVIGSANVGSSVVSLHQYSLKTNHLINAHHMPL